MNETIISSFLSFCETHKRLSPHTLRAYKNDLLQFYNSDYERVESYIEYLTKSDIRSNTLRRKIASLKVFYNYLRNENIIDENPLSQMRFQFRKEKILPKTIPIEVLRSIYSYLEQKVLESKTEYQIKKNKRNLLIISLLLSTGIRISELCHIKLDHIHLSNSTLHIIGKGKKERIIFLGDLKTVNLLEEYVRKYCNQKIEYLFIGKDAVKELSEQSVRLLLKKVVEANDISITITPHMFRHSFATMLLDKNVDIRYIQQMLGHSSISVTQIYTHVSQSKQKEILSSCNPISVIKS